MEETIKIVREKYIEIIEIFPNNPKGFYGIAITSPMIGDIKNGIRDIDIAINKNNYENVEALLLKAMLLTLDQRLEESLYYYNKIRFDLKDNDDFQANYALSLHEVSKKIMIKNSQD